MKACDVCSYFGDDAPKETKYCSICKKNICDKCRYSPRRLEAAGVHLLQKVVKTFGNLARA